MTQTRCLRIEHCQGWHGAGIAKCRDSETGPQALAVALVALILFDYEHVFNVPNIHRSCPKSIDELVGPR